MHRQAEKIQGLYAIADTAVCGDDDIVEKAGKVLAAGCRVLQYRDKTNNYKKRLFQAENLRKLCAKVGAVFIVNDDPELAAQVGADGVHCGSEDAGIRETRQKYPELLIGASCYNSLKLADQAIVNGVDYIAFGRFYSSLTKPQASPANIDTLIQAREKFSLPIVAIGGIVAENAGILISSGASAVAVISGIFSTEDPYLSSKEICELFNAKTLDDNLIQYKQR